MIKLGKTINSDPLGGGVTLAASSFLRRILWTDALVSAVSGIAVAVLAGWLVPILGLPQALLRNAGLILLPFAALVIFAATRVPVSRGLVRAVIAINLIWVIDSIALLLSGWVSPTGLGYALVLIQAAGVAVLAELEYLGLRRVV